MRSKEKEPTFTSLVESWLSQQDDFRTVQEIVDGTGVNVNRVRAALHNAKNFKAASFLVDNGITYWYATPESDTRTKHVEERVREEPGTRRARKGRSSPGGGLRQS